MVSHILEIKQIICSGIIFSQDPDERAYNNLLTAYGKYSKRTIIGDQESPERTMVGKLAKSYFKVNWHLLNLIIKQTS